MLAAELLFLPWRSTQTTFFETTMTTLCTFVVSLIMADGKKPSSNNSNIKTRIISSRIRKRLFASESLLVTAFILLLAVSASLLVIIPSCVAFQIPTTTTTTTTTTATTRSSRRQRAVSNLVLQQSQFSQESNKKNDVDLSINDQSRRGFLQSTTAGAGAAVALLGTTALLTANPEAAHAGSLIQFPCDRPLKNRYHFMRAATSQLEADGIYSTNPLFITNRENGMDQNAADQILEACEKIKASGNLPTVVYHSLAANGAFPVNYLVFISSPF